MPIGAPFGGPLGGPEGGPFGVFFSSSLSESGGVESTFLAIYVINDS